MSEFIGIYGGAFDPPHISHIQTAKALLLERKYDKLILLPSHNPPHKMLSATDADRLNMLKFVTDNKIILSDLEIKRDGVGYTVDILPELIKQYGDNIEFIIGGDSFLNFDKWYKPLEILKLVKILVVARDGEVEKLQDKLKEYDNIPKLGITIAKYLPKSMSSSEIRNKLRLHIVTCDLLDKKVIYYINKHNLYNEYDSLVKKLKSQLSEERFLHTQGVVLYALKYADKLKLDYNKVFIASLLHDSAKTNLNYDYIYNKNLVPIDSKNTPVAHAFCGAVVANLEYGIENKEILDAIYCHTTAKPNMSQLAKLIYCADMLEEGRNFDGVEKLREIFDKDFEQGFVACLKQTVDFLKSGNKEIYPLTLDAYEFYNKT